MSHSVDANKKRLSSLIRVHMFKINNASRIPGVIDKQLADGIIISYCTTVPDSAQSVFNLDFDDGHKPTLINNIFILNKKASGNTAATFMFIAVTTVSKWNFCFLLFWHFEFVFLSTLFSKCILKKKKLIDWLWLVLNISLCTFNFAINEMLKNYNNKCSIN